MSDLVPLERIENRIYMIRGQKVMLDMDLAELYGVPTRRLNEQVKRNAARFPEDFMFSLSREEILRISQFATSSSLKFYKNINVFTEYGVAMLSSVLKSERALQVNIAIMRAFVKLRQMISTHKELARKVDELEDRVDRHDTRIMKIIDTIRRLMEPGRN
jgi:hypothetical protein